MSEPDMEVAEPENEMMTMMNFSFKKHGFEYRFLRPFEFDDDFNKLDEGQTQTDPTILKEIDLLDQLRDARKRDSKRIPQTIFEFYDNCRKHFAKEFMLLLAGFMSNAEKAKKMDGHIKDDRLFNFFNIKLDGPIKFGKHQIFDDCAADCEAEAKTKLRACGMEIQKLVQLGREKATEAARNKLQACSEDFKTFGEKEWRKQCSNTSLHNILDQHFAVQSPLINASDEDDSGGEQCDDAVGRRESFTLWKASDWLYNVAIHESKKDVDQDIRHRRAQVAKARADAAALRARQAQVNICADAAKPHIVLADHLTRLDQQCEALKEDIRVIQTTGPAGDSTDADKTSSGNGPTAIQQLQQKVKQHETQLQALQACVPQGASKNDTRAGSTATPQPAGKNKRRRNKRQCQNETEDATAEPDSSTTVQPKTKKRPGSQHPRPPTPNNASGNGKAANQQQRGGQHGAQRQKPGPEPTDDSAPQPPDVKRRQNDAQRHRHSNQRGRGGGPGRGRGRGY
jgi:hypothetical protein